MLVRPHFPPTGNRQIQRRQGRLRVPLRRAHATEFSKLGRIPVLKARMNADLHIAENLKNTGKGNLFVIFGEPDITLLPQDDGKLRVKVNGVDVFKPQTGEVTSHGTDGIAYGGSSTPTATRKASACIKRWEIAHFKPLKDW